MTSGYDSAGFVKNQELLNLILKTICGTGIRVAELKYFTVEAVKEEEITVRCKSKTRMIFVLGELKRMILNFARLHGAFIMVQYLSPEMAIYWTEAASGHR